MPTEHKLFLLQRITPKSSGGGGGGAGAGAGAVAWWLMPRTPDPEVGGSSPTRVKPCCVLEQGAFTPQKYW